MRLVTRLGLSALVALAMVGNWWLFYGAVWMDETNHALFGVLLFLLLGSRSIYVVPIAAIGWEAWELWRYPVAAFTPGANCYQDDTVLDILLPVLTVLLLDRLDQA